MKMKEPPVTVDAVIGVLQEMEATHTIYLDAYRGFRAPVTGDTVLHIAASIDAQEAVFFAKQLGFDLNVRNKCGETPLHLAVVEDNVSVVGALLENGADVNALNDSGQTALHYAVIFNSYESLNKIIYSSDVNVFVQDVVGWTALHYTAINANIDMLQLLLSTEPRLLEVVSAMGVSVLHLLSMSNSVVICQRAANNVVYTISFLYDPSKKVLESKLRDEQGSSAQSLDLAFIEETRKALSSMPGNIQQLAERSSVQLEYSPAIFVTTEHYERCIRWLHMDFLPTLGDTFTSIKALFGRDNLGRTPLHYAAFMGSYRSLYTLISYINTCIQKSYQDDLTGTCIAVGNCYDGEKGALSRRISPLVAREGGIGFDFFAHPDNTGLTPLQLACMSGIAACKLKLLATVCDVTTSTHALGNAMHCAVRAGSHHTVVELVSIVTRMVLLKTGGTGSSFLLDFLLERDYHGTTSFALMVKSDWTIERIISFLLEYSKLVMLLDPQSLLIFLDQVRPLSLLIKATGLFSKRGRHMLTGGSMDEGSAVEEVFSVVFGWYDRVSVDIHSLVVPTGVFQVPTGVDFSIQQAYSVLTDFIGRCSAEQTQVFVSLEALSVYHLRKLVNAPKNGANGKDKAALVDARKQDSNVYFAVFEVMKAYSSIVSGILWSAAGKSFSSGTRKSAGVSAQVLDVIEEQHVAIHQEFREGPRPADMAGNIQSETVTGDFFQLHIDQRVPRAYKALLDTPPLLTPMIDAIYYNNKIAFMLLLTHQLRDENLQRMGSMYQYEDISTSLSKYLAIIENKATSGSAKDDAEKLLTQETPTNAPKALCDLFGDLNLGFAAVWKAEAIMNALIVSVFAGNYGVFCILCSLMPASYYRCDLLLFLLGTFICAESAALTPADQVGSSRFSKIQQSAFQCIEFILDHLISAPITRRALADTVVLVGSTNLIDDITVFVTSVRDSNHQSLRASIRSALPLICHIHRRMSERTPGGTTLTPATPLVPLTMPRKIVSNRGSSVRVVPLAAFLLLVSRRFGQGLLKYTRLFMRLGVACVPGPHMLCKQTADIGNGSSIWHYFASETHQAALCNELFPVPELFRRAVKNLCVVYGIGQHTSNVHGLYSYSETLKLRTVDRYFIERPANVNKQTRKIKTMKIFDHYRYNRQPVAASGPVCLPAFGTSMVDASTADAMVVEEQPAGTSVVCYEDGISNIQLIVDTIVSAVILWAASLRYKLEFLYERMHRIIPALNGCAMEFTYDDLKVLQTLILTQLEDVPDAATGDSLGKDEEGLSALEVAVRYGSPTSLLLLVINGRVPHDRLNDASSLNPFIAEEAKLEEGLAKRVEMANRSGSPVAVLNAMHMIWTVSVFNSRLIWALTKLQGIKSDRCMFERAHAVILEQILARCPLKFQLLLDPSPVDNVIRYYMVSSKASSMYKIMTDALVKSALHEVRTLGALSGEDSRCGVCNTAAGVVERLVSKPQKCTRCKRTLCSRCARSVGQLKGAQIAMCTPCFYNWGFSRLMHLSENFAG